MALSIDDIRDRLNRLKNQTKKDNDLWKPNDEHVVRCVPNKHGDASLNELYFHYDVGFNKPIKCPAMNYDDDCALCEFAEQLKNWNTPDGVPKEESIRKADFEVFKKVQAKPRWFIPVVERGKEAAGVRWWSLSKMPYNDLLDICAEEENNADRDDDGAELVITSPTSAYDLKVSFAKPGEKGNDSTYTKIKVKEKKKLTELASTKKERDELLNSVKNLEDVCPKVTSGEVKKKLMAWINSVEATNGANKVKTETVGQQKYSTNSKETSKTGGKSVEDVFMDGTSTLDDAFEKMVNE